MLTTMKIDPNQFVGKMEAYAIGGLRGASSIETILLVYFNKRYL